MFLILTTTYLSRKPVKGRPDDVLFFRSELVCDALIVSLCDFLLIYVSRRGPGQEYVKSTLGDTILRLVAYDKSLEVDPLKIYQEMVDNEEVKRPAEADKLLLEVKPSGV